MFVVRCCRHVSLYVASPHVSILHALVCSGLDLCIFQRVSYRRRKTSLRRIILIFFFFCHTTQWMMYCSPTQTNRLWKCECCGDQSAGDKNTVKLHDRGLLTDRTGEKSCGGFATHQMLASSALNIWFLYIL